MKDIHALKERARSFVAGNKLRKASGVLADLAQLEPDNPRWSHKLGQIHQRLGNSSGAISAFQRAADAYARKGFLLKAIAICKLILGLDPDHQQTLELLSDFYARQDPQLAPAPPPPPPLPEPLPEGAEDTDGIPVDVDSSLTADFFANREEIHESNMLRRPPEIEALIMRTAHAGAEAAAEPEPPPEPEVIELEAEPPPRQKRPTLPPGETLDVIDLGEAIPEALAAETAQHIIYEIPLDEDDDTTIEIPMLSDTSQRLLEQLPLTPIFSSLDRAALRMLIERVDIRIYGQGEQIIRQGETGDTLFVLVEGEVEVYREADGERVELDRLKEGSFFGEIALLTKLERSASVEATEESTLLEISRALLSELIEEHPHVLKMMLRFFRARLIDTLVETHELFAAYSGADRQQLSERFAFIQVPAGFTILDPAAPADGFYILLTGRAERRSEGESEQLASGEIFGERSLIEGGNATRSIVAASRCWLLKLSREIFREVIMTHPHVLAVISDMAARREREQQEATEGKIPLL